MSEDNKAPEYKGTERRSSHSNLEYLVEKLADHVKFLSDQIEEQRVEFKAEMEEQKLSTKDLIEAWATAKGFVSFIKWLASASTAALVLYQVFKDKLH